MKDLACKRIQSRINPSYSNIDEYYKIRKSCHLVEVVETTMGTEYLCDCHFGIKGKLCKHSMGLVYLLEPSFEVAPTLNPLKFVGRKRGKGRPALVAPALDKRLPKNIRITEINREIPHDDQEDAVQITIDNPVEISEVREDAVQVDLENKFENSEVIEDQYEESGRYYLPSP